MIVNFILDQLGPNMLESLDGAYAKLESQGRRDRLCVKGQGEQMVWVGKKNLGRPRTFCIRSRGFSELKLILCFAMTFRWSATW